MFVKLARNDIFGYLTCGIETAVARYFVFSHVRIERKRRRKKTAQMKLKC